MSSIRAFLLKKNFLIRIILSYLFVGLLVLGALTFMITNKVSSKLTLEINSSTDRAIEQSYNAAQILLNSTYINYASAFHTADIQLGFYGDEFSTLDMWRIGSRLTELANSNPLVHSVYLINPKKKLVFSSLSTVRSFGEFYDANMLSLLDSLQPHHAGIFIPRYAKFQVDGRTYEQNLISILYSNVREEKSTSGAMVLNLDQDVLQSTVMNGVGSASFQSMILNSQGTIISHTDGQRINTNVSNEPYVEEILAAKEQKGNLQATIDGKTSHVSYIKSESLGWIFIGTVNYDLLLDKVNEMKSYILWVTAIMLIIVAASGAFFTRMIYGPIQRLLVHVRKSSPDSGEQEAVSEMDKLSGTFHYLQNKIHDLQFSVASYQSTERLQALRLLTRGGWAGEQEMARKLGNAGISFPHPQFIVSLFRLDAYKELSELYSQADISLLKYAISNIAEELGSSRGIQVASFEDEGDAITFIANLPEDAQAFMPHIHDLLADIQAHVAQFLKLSVSAAMGIPVSGMPRISESWHAAYAGSRYRIALGKGCLIQADVRESRESLTDAQYLTMEKQIIDQLKLGDRDKTEAVITEYMAALSNAPYDEMMLLLTQLLIATARAAKTMAAESDEMPLDIEYLGQQLYQWETLEQIEAWYKELCAMAMSLREHQASQKNRLIVDKVKHYIHEHYVDSNLTVETLVEVGGLSTNYMRKVFKEITGSSITVYLSEYRFAKARELLTTTDLPANRIGEMVGFDNTNYFYVSFKKHIGKTPDHYRKSYETGGSQA
ncbi:helix-turn-helix domain-containing protein [Paenibacillus puerhi]|uniref:helix-turn-helix domain-containing protein n=1 Tax=Paenibacillus puerhi TaxID=2692622 RepID=UPI001357C9EE|nr:helix-turn-helix domain-containing protein [Paenibacillus puerhi]